MSGHRSITIRMGTVAAAAVLIAACGSSGHGVESLPTVAASPADTPTPPATAPTATQVAAPASSAPPVTGGKLAACSDLTLALSSDKTTYGTGETVHLTAMLTNAGTTTCTIEAGAERGFAVASGASAIWRSGCSSTPAGHTATEPCPQFLSLTPIKAGQTLTRTQDWSQQADGTDKQVTPGNYLVAESWAGSNASAMITIS